MKIGILGGSFNPVHNGHLRVAIEAKEQMDLDRVDLVPAAHPPHKKDSQILPFYFRCLLLEKALEVCPGVEVNNLEGKRPGPSYTIDTLQEYKELEPGCQLFFILGCNDFLTLPTWHNWRELFNYTHFLIVGRYGNELEQLDKFVADYFSDMERSEDNSSTWVGPQGANIYFINIPRLDISGTLVRDKIHNSWSLDFLVPEKVSEAIYQHKEFFQ